MTGYVSTHPVVTEVERIYIFGDAAAVAQVVSQPDLLFNSELLPLRYRKYLVYTKISARTGSLVR